MQHQILVSLHHLGCQESIINIFFIIDNYASSLKTYQIAIKSEISQLTMTWQSKN